MRNEIYTMSTFDDSSGVVHGFSTQFHGDMGTGKRRSIQKLQPFSRALGIQDDQIVGMEQVHGKNIHKSIPEDKGTIISDTDGLWTGETNEFLYATFADCVPILAYHKKGYVAIAHVGWKGASLNIASELVKNIVDEGLKPEDLIVGLGPSIRICCYGIDLQRAGAFSQYNKAIEERDGNYFLSLQAVISQQLREAGVERIEDCGICTKDDSRFFSYRNDHSENFPVFAGVIGLSS